MGPGVRACVTQRGRTMTEAGGSRSGGHVRSRLRGRPVNRALREAADRQEEETDDLADWFQEVCRRLGEVDPRPSAWRR